jgi:predicted transcriptional regulator
MSVTSVRLQTELELPLDELAGKLSRSKNWIINQAIKDYISAQTLEETRWQETLQALESVRQGKVVDGDTVHAWMKSWGTDNELDVPKV